MTVSARDGSLNLVQFKTSTPTGGEHVGTTTLTDATSGNEAAIVAVNTQDGEALGTAYGLVVGNFPQLIDVAGLPNRQREAGADLVVVTGFPGAVPMLAHEYRKTATTTVASGATSATIAMSDTTGFRVGGIANFEPGSASNYEPARIIGVTANTNITVQFPAGGALHTHTANYTIQTFLLVQSREAPGARGVALVSADGSKPTYRAGAVAQTLYSTAAAVLVEVIGSATRTVRVKKITLWGQAGTKFYAELTLLRCTAASGGTPAAAALGQHDTGDDAATATVNYYTAAATQGTGHAVMGALPLSLSPPSANSLIQPAVWDFSRNQDKALILRGTGDVIQVYNNTTTLGTATYGFEVEFEEDDS